MRARQFVCVSSTCCVVATLRVLHRLDLLLLLGGHVRRDKELSKQDKERQDVDNVHESDPRTAGSTLGGDQVGSLRHHGNKLDHLHHGQAGLPPDRQRPASFGHTSVHANEVVRVHDGVDESIQSNGKVNVTIVVDVRVEPVEKEDSNVMVHMKEGQLSPLLANDDKDGVPEIPNLGHVKEPQ